MLTEECIPCRYRGIPMFTFLTFYIFKPIVLINITEALQCSFGIWHLISAHESVVIPISQIQPIIMRATAAKLNLVPCIQQRLLAKCSYTWLCHGWWQTPKSQQTPGASYWSKGPCQHNSTNPSWQANHSLRKPCSTQFLDSVGRVTAMLKFHFSLMLAVNCSITLFLTFFSVHCFLNCQLYL